MKPFLTKFGHLIFHGIALLAVGGTAYTDYVPPKYKPLAYGIIALSQGIVALAHHNPNS